MSFKPLNTYDADKTYSQSGVADYVSIHSLVGMDYIRLVTLNQSDKRLKEPSIAAAG
ncbi:hypothetical protein [Candidatus Bathycorpusculum sp.]|uniref:hypothetical protein n=1 Tax=Candidatus Bathycorpusculum sp. TaxID=2994959 RepID=UPI002835B00F|nr:hypothetical protein [Candidatus Termitimicrobium sp.]